MRLVASACAVAAVVTVASASAAIHGQPKLTYDAPVSGLALAHGSLWVSIGGDDLVLRLDARTGRRLARSFVHRANLSAVGTDRRFLGRSDERPESHRREAMNAQARSGLSGVGEGPLLA